MKRFLALALVALLPSLAYAEVPAPPHPEPVAKFVADVPRPALPVANVVVPSKQAPAFSLPTAPYTAPVCSVLQGGSCAITPQTYQSYSYSSQTYASGGYTTSTFAGAKPRKSGLRLRLFRCNR